MATADVPLLRLLGAPVLRAGGAAVPFLPERRCQLLALLGLRSGQWVERDRIAQLFWPEHPPAEARRNLRKVIFRARELPGTQLLQATDHALCWPVATDVQAFEQALREHRHDEAVAMMSGTPLAGLEEPADTAWSDWLGAERSRLVTAWQEALRVLLAHARDDTRRQALAQQLLDADPLDESAVAALIDCDLTRGDEAAARRRYRHYAERLASELGIEPSNALRERLRGAAAVPGPGAAPRAAPAAGRAGVPGLPPAGVGDAGRFIGRRSELGELDALLALPALRLLTLLGPGGVGQSRLAREALARCERHFPAGARWVELQDLQDLPALTARLAQTLGVEINDTRDALATVCGAAPLAGPGRVLLVLDNAEHLAGLPTWLERLLDAAPAATVLVTSRVRLQCAAERPVPLAGLAVPDEDSRDLEAAQAFDAVRLFEACAQQAWPGFVLAQHLAAVLQVIDTVGGLPLAIALAAGWVRLLPPTEIARELQQSVEVLQRDPAQHGAAARPEHDSLAATLEGSWRLLAPREREALAALAVFEGGFTRAAAQAVAQASLPLLASLFDRSLLQADEHGRFSMHPYAAAWARGKLAEAPARAAAVRGEHAAYFARWMDDQAPLARHAPRQLVERLSAEQANWAQAWRVALAAADWAAVRRMLPPLMAYFETQGRWNEGLALLQPALNAPDTGGADAGARARTLALDAVATLQYRRGELRQAEANAAAAATLARQLGEAEVELTSLNTLGLALWNQGRSLEALPQLERALGLARAGGSQRALARALSTLAIAEKAAGRYDLALPRQLEVLALQRALGDARGLCSALNNVGNLHRIEKRLHEALPFFEEGLALATEHGLTVPRCFHSLNLGLTLQELGRTVPARVALEAALAEVRRAGQPQAEMSALMALAACDITEQHFDDGVQRLRDALAQSRALGFHAHVLETLAVFARLCQARGDGPVAAQLWAFLGEQPALDEAIRAEAREHLAAAGLSAEALANAQAQAAALDLERACALLGPG
ncbi:MAG: tetratricopeptide repeat protein [Burkholderiales bacterium]|nr:tetratricopeptide repeat protein [Burkholderiales bacterium]